MANQKIFRHAPFKGKGILLLGTRSDGELGKVFLVFGLINVIVGRRSGRGWSSGRRVDVVVVCIRSNRRGRGFLLVVHHGPHSLFVLVVVVVFRHWFLFHDVLHEVVPIGCFVHLGLFCCGGLCGSCMAVPPYGWSFSSEALEEKLLWLLWWWCLSHFSVPVSGGRPSLLHFRAFFKNV